MINKEFNIRLDILSSTVKKTNIEVVQNDKNTNIFNFTLYKNGIVIDLTSLVNQSISIKLANGKTYIGKPVVVVAINGTMTYTLQTDDISGVGEAIATVELFEGTDNRITTCMFTFNVRADLGSSGYVSTNDFPTLTKLINAYDNEPVREANENLRIAQEDLRENAEILRMINEDDRTDGYNAMIQNGYLIWKAPVQNFSDLAVVYPTPQENWTVQVVNDSGKVYKYSNSAWGYVFTANITNIANYYKWREEKTVLAGANSFTLTNSYNSANMKLEILDTTWHVLWLENENYSISGQVVTLPTIINTTTFIIKAI